VEQVLQDVSSARGAADAVLMAIHQEVKNGFLRRATEAKEELDGPKLDRRLLLAREVRKLPHESLTRGMKLDVVDAGRLSNAWWFALYSPLMKV